MSDNQYRRSLNKIFIIIKIRGVEFSVKKILCLCVYYGFATYLPDSYPGYNDSKCNLFNS